MKAFSCRICGSSLFFENSVCVSCGTWLGFSRAERDLVPVDGAGRYVDHTGKPWWVCRNLGIAGCTWLTDEPVSDCFACRLTRTRPNDEDAVGIAEFLSAESAKRHLVVELDTLGFRVVGKDVDPENGLAFDMLSSAEENVVIGHADGVITIDLAETRPEHREKVRVELDEPYRTMLGHLRHEVGHYYQWQIIVGGPLQERSRALFGDERKDYQTELDRHYSQGPPAHWEQDYISTYATMHPFEDFAETFAHHLHISDTIETARTYGLVPSTLIDTGFRDRVVQVWIPLTVALNQINRSMGKEDLYPFVLPPAVLDKLEFVAALAGLALRADSSSSA